MTDLAKKEVAPILTINFSKGDFRVPFLKDDCEECTIPEAEFDRFIAENALEVRNAIVEFFFSTVDIHATRFNLKRLKEKSCSDPG